VVTHELHNKQTAEAKQLGYDMIQYI